MHDSVRISRNASFWVACDPLQLFHLLTPHGEEGWVPGWKPEYIFPKGGNNAEGMVFITPPRFEGEAPYTWLMSEHDPERLCSTFVVHTNERIWTIRVQVVGENRRARAEVTYIFTGLSPEGSKRNQMALEAMFSEELQDWKALIDAHLGPV